MDVGIKSNGNDGNNGSNSDNNSNNNNDVGIEDDNQTNKTNAYDDDVGINIAGGLSPGAGLKLYILYTIYITIHYINNIN